MADELSGERETKPFKFVTGKLPAPTSGRANIGMRLLIVVFSWYVLSLSTLRDQSRH